ncbi:MAG: TetR/AcrR family transcriptional regulator [Magnetospiraceae bacterium]
MATNGSNRLQSSARRGRPRSFDRDEALFRALSVFQKNGYEGTSMAQLVDAMGIVSPSIYAAFGSKEDLFREAVEMYSSTMVEPIWVKLDEITDVELAVQTMLFAFIDMFSEAGEKHGCLVMLGTSHLGQTAEGARTFLRQQRQGFKARLAARFERSTRDGTLAPDNDPETLAECVLAFFGGLAIESVDGTERNVQRRTAQLFCERFFR